ncbi:MAG: DUF3418 domain-containing protein, partial [Janthinobacterium lividum]
PSLASGAPLNEGVIDALLGDIRQQKQVQVRTTDFKLETLAPHLFMNFKVIDEHSRQLAMGRNLAQLRVEFGAQAQQLFAEIALAGVQRDGGTGDEADDESLGGDVGTGGGTNGSVNARSDGKAISSSGRGARGVPAASGQGARDARANTGTSTATGTGTGGAAAAGPAGKPSGTGKGAAGQGAGTNALYENLTSWSFGKLPELLEIRRGGNTLYGYPALVDRGTHVEVQVFDSPQEAAPTHRAGLRRLFALQLREPLKFLEKNLSSLQQMAMQFMSLGTLEELRRQVIDCTIDRACLAEPLPDDEASFVARRDEGRGRLSLLGQEVARLVGTILAEYTDVSKKLLQAKSFTAAHDDMQQQLQALVHKRFIAETPYRQLAHFPRYLKGIALRTVKLKADTQRDARASAEFAPLRQQYQRVAGQWRTGADPRLDEFRWLLEELRISLFAQELKTPMPVSVKRLHKVWESMQR